MNPILNLLKPDAADRDEFRRMAAAAKFGCKLAVSVVAVVGIIALCSFTFFGFMMAGDMTEKALDLIWIGRPRA